jgi:predicted alpha/beta-fold hydrolase
MRRLSSLAALLLVTLALAGPARAKSQQEYLDQLRSNHFKPFHFNPWDAVLHPIDYWCKHTREERKLARKKVWDFVQGKEFVPEGFKRVLVKAGELTVEGHLYLQDESPRPLIIMLPGTFGSHLSSYMSETASLLTKSGHYHVLLMAMRMSPSTMRAMKVVGSGGFFEAQDILGAVRWLKGASPWSNLFERVGLYGVSLSCDYVVQAMAADTEHLVDAGLLISGSYDIQNVGVDIDRKAHSIDVIRYFWARLFHKYLRTHLLQIRDSTAVDFSDDEVKRLGLADYLAKISWRFYKDRLQQIFGPSFGVPELIQLSTALNYLDRVHAPLLAVHSHQDRYLGYSHADQFRARAIGNPFVALEYVDGAQHANYFIHDPKWFGVLLDSYYQYWLAPNH